LKIIRLILSSIALLAFWTTGFSQHTPKLSGRVIDKTTGEALVGATIQINNTNSGTITNEKGFYLFHLENGNYTLKFSFIGYITQTVAVNVPEMQQLDIQMELSSVQADEIIVTADNPRKNVESVEDGTIELNMKEIKNLPALMGETDFLRVIQLSPGVQSANDANMGFYVRGGGADQNLILFDNVPVYNPSHVLGFFSVFNSDVIRSTKLIKSGMPANYGGRISSIIDINTRDGDFENFHYQGSIGLLLSKFSVQGPLVKNRLSFLLSARKSYIDNLFKPLANSLFDINSTFYTNTEYNFTDLNGKLSFRLSPKQLFTLTAYNGIDNFNLIKLEPDYKNGMKWGNRLYSLNWNYQVSTDWNIQSTLGYTKYNFGLTASQENISIAMVSAVKDYIFRTEATRAGYNGQIIKFGAEYYYHNFTPNNLDASTNGQPLAFGSNRTLNADEASLFYNHELNLGKHLRVNLGLRYTYYRHVGPYYEINKNEIGEITDSTYYKPGEKIQHYQSPEPRISARYQLNSLASLKASYTLNKQYVHMLSSSSVTLPTDVWLPSTSIIKPQWGQQFTMGYYRNFLNNSYETSVSLYYKDFYNQIELLNGIVNNFQDNIFEESATFGRGYSYGAEFFVQKSAGNFTGWIGYTLSVTNRIFSEINQGKVYPAKYDRRHDLNLVTSYDFNKKWNASATFILASGNALTLPSYKYIMEGNVISGYGERNSFRMPLYHRMDISITYIARKTEKFESSFNFSVYNVYNRANPFYIYFEITGNVYDYNLKITPKQVSIFPILPSLTWNFRF
jgi:hypothetical protein